MNDNVVSLTDDGFEGFIVESKLPVIVDFWADWCGPCKVMAPIFKEVADEYVGKVVFASLNIDKHMATAPKFGVRGIPTLLFFTHGKVKGTQVGALSKIQLKTFIDGHL